MRAAQRTEKGRAAMTECEEPIHEWFGLTYASYLVLPRSILQSAPVELQRRIVACLEELHERFGDTDPPNGYAVNWRGKDGRFLGDPYADYARGRRRIPEVQP